MGKEGAMLFNYKPIKNGFIFSEIVVSLSIIFTLIFTLTPIFYQLHTERLNLYYRRTIQSLLHDQLIQIDSNDKKMPSINKKVKQTSVDLYFTLDDPLWKGCAEWENAKKKNEKLCLFYYSSG